MTSRTLYTVCLILLGGVLSAFSEPAQIPDYYFKQISIDQGLSQSRVQCIHRDRLGVIWIGTKNGLNSYAQSELRTFRHDRNDTNSLPDNYIRFIAEDSEGLLYISTNKGVSVYDRMAEQFRPLAYKGQAFQAWSYMPTESGFLFGHEKTIFRYDTHTKELRPIFEATDGEERKQINHIFHWQGKSRLIASSRRDGIWIFDLQRRVMHRCPFVKERDINAIFVDSRERLWVSLYGKGVRCYDKTGKELYNLSTRNSGLNNDIVFDFLENGEQIWMATDGGGINIFDCRTGVFSYLRHRSDDRQSLPNNSVYCLYKDPRNNIWGGSVHEGLFEIKEVFIRNFRDVPLQNINGISEQTVISIYEDEDKLLYIGTDGGGINAFDQERGVFHHFTSTYGEKISSMANFSPQELVVSCFNKGTYLFHKRTGQMRPFPIVNDSITKKEFSSGDLVNLYATDDKVYILGARIYIYDKASRKITTLYAPDIDAERKIAVQPVASDERFLYLIGTHDLFKLDMSSNSLTSLWNTDGVEELTSACKDNDGNFWIGSNYGLSCYDTKAQTVRKIPTNLFNNVSGLACDKKGRLWIGAQNMLFAYVIKEKRFIILDESDGMPSNELIFTPIPRLRTEYLYMGGTRGLVRINTNIRFGEDYPHILRLLDFRLNGKSAWDRFKGKKISIPWNHSSLSLKVLVDEKSTFRKHLFRYVISGGKTPIETESYNHTLEMGTLPSGKYVVSVSCNTQNGEWSEPTELATILVLPPWWKSLWFILLCVFLSLLAVGVGIYLLMRRKNQRMKREMQEYERKTYEEKIRFLINVSHELRTPLTLIYASVKRILNGETDTKKTSEYLNGIYRQAGQMKDIINMVLNVRRMEAGHEVLHIALHPLHQWIKETADSFLIELKARGIELSLDFDSRIGDIAFDETKCRIILSNLLMNALKYGGSGTRITIRTNLIESHVRVSVSDQGIGLANVDIDKLFTRFYQGKHKEEGDGIGLSYAKMLVNLQGGQIGAYNNTDGGATFFYELPLGMQTQDVSCPEHPYLNELINFPETVKTVEEESFPLNRYALLIVEDKAELRNFLKDYFKPQVRKIYEAEDGVQALDMIYRNQPDIVISDVMMPRMDGYQLCKTIKEDLSVSHIPVILLTARADTGSRLTGYKQGADAYLSKPFELAVLQSVMASLIRNRENIKSHYRESRPMLTPQEATFSNVDEQFLTRLNEIIDANLSETGLDVKFLTDKMAMSRTSLYAKIKGLTGMGVNDYINRKRIERASYLLSHSDKSITEISEAVGFTYQRYFSTLFKEIKGVTPSQFRSENQQAAERETAD